MMMIAARGLQLTCNNAPWNNNNQDQINQQRLDTLETNNVSSQSLHLPNNINSHNWFWGMLE
jgi:hypothetical protein